MQCFSERRTKLCKALKFKICSNVHVFAVRRWVGELTSPGFGQHVSEALLEGCSHPGSHCAFVAFAVSVEGVVNRVRVLAPQTLLHQDLGPAGYLGSFQAEWNDGCITGE